MSETNRTNTEDKPEFPRLNMSVTPTPIHRLEWLSRTLGVEIWCKRDDLTGFAMGGNKTRKLDYLVADAIRLGSDTLVAIGANQSNFCRMTAGAGAVNGLEVHLVLWGAEPEHPTGNLRLDHLYGAHVHHVDTPDWREWERRGRALAKELEAQGRRVYFLPVGGSTATGARGYVAAMGEIVEFSRQQVIDFDLIIHASSSGGTHAGLLAGKALHGWPGWIVAAGVAGTEESLRETVADLLTSLSADLEIQIPASTIEINHSCMGPEYAARTEACAEAVRLMARTEAIVLDNVYSGKAAALLIKLARTGHLDGLRTLFIHTGGAVEFLA